MTVLFDEPQPGIRRITLNRPGALNALTKDLLVAFRNAVEEASADSRCRAIIITGAGNAFCSGVDLKAPGFDEFLAERDPIEGRLEWSEFMTDSLMSVVRSSTPVIAAVNGTAVGAGLSLALLCDIRIAARRATFANAYIRNGLSACELGTSYLLPKLIGSGRALELMLTGRTVGVDEAHAIGLVTEVADDDELAERAESTAGMIARNAAFGTAMTKQVAYANLTASSLDEAMLLEMRTQMLALHTADSKEARAAIVERRTPNFTGFRTR